MILQVASEEDHLLGVQSHSAGVGGKDSSGQQLTQLRGEVSRQSWAGQHVCWSRVPRPWHKDELALFLVQTEQN